MKFIRSDIKPEINPDNVSYKVLFSDDFNTPHADVFLAIDAIFRNVSIIVESPLTYEMKRFDTSPLVYEASYRATYCPDTRQFMYYCDCYDTRNCRIHYGECECQFEITSDDLHHKLLIFITENLALIQSGAGHMRDDDSDYEHWNYFKPPS